MTFRLWCRLLSTDSYHLLCVPHHLYMPSLQAETLTESASICFKKEADRWYMYV